MAGLGLHSMGTGYHTGQPPDSVHLSTFRKHWACEGQPAVTKHGRGAGHFLPRSGWRKAGQQPLRMKLKPSNPPAKAEGSLQEGRASAWGLGTPPPAGGSDPLSGEGGAVELRLHRVQRCNLRVENENQVAMSPSSRRRLPASRCQLYSHFKVMMTL